jgi:hypothetical protein
MRLLELGQTVQWPRSHFGVLVSLMAERVGFVLVALT